MKRWILFLAILLVPALALAHKPSDSYLSLQRSAEKVTGTWDLSLKDLEIAVGIDANGDGSITWAELKNLHSSIETYGKAHLSISQSGIPCLLSFLPQSVINYSDGAYTHIPLTAVCPAGKGPLEIAYSAFFDFDPLHRGILKFTEGETTAVRVFSPQQSEQVLTPNETGAWLTARQFFIDGVWHILSGYDHILFLVALLLACLGSSTKKTDSSGRITGFSAIKIVTAFTLAHSITLSLAVLKIISLPSQLVESLIAVTVLLATANVCFSIIDERKLWLVTFCFGLIHGFGFATVLLDLQLPSTSLAIALASFNVGVEAAQLLLVIIFLPPALMLQRARNYDLIVKKGGSIIIMLLSGYWFLQRAFNL